MSKAVVCIAETDAQMEAIVGVLKSRGLATNNISVIDVYDLFPEMEAKARWRKNPNGRGLVPDHSDETEITPNIQDSLELKKTG